MYIMAFNEFYNSGPATGDSSYHGVAGIHGLPASYGGYTPGSNG
jgi:hypothetical protein